MSVFFDTSAVLALHIESSLRRLSIDALDDVPCVSALALTEAPALIPKLTREPVLHAALHHALHLQCAPYPVRPVASRATHLRARPPP